MSITTLTPKNHFTTGGLTLPTFGETTRRIDAALAEALTEANSYDYLPVLLDFVFHASRDTWLTLLGREWQSMDNIGLHQQELEEALAWHEALEAFTKLRRIYLEFVPPQRPRKVCAPRAEKNASRPPLNGVEAEFTGPLNGVEGPLATPLDGPVMHLNGRPPTPFNGDCIDIPSARSAAQGDSKGGKPRGGPRAPRAIGPRGA